MNYYILPKNNNKPHIFPCFTNKNNLVPHISHSLIIYLNKANENFINICNTIKDSKDVDLINKMINTYEFIFTNVPNSLLSVSKMKPDSNLFYELMEIFVICNIQDFFESKSTIHTCHFSPHFNSSIYLLNMIRETQDDFNIGKNFEINEINEFIKSSDYLLKFDFLFFEFKNSDYKNNNIYFKNIILSLIMILQTQNINGIAIIKIDEIIHKVIIDVLFILSTLFEKIYIIKPQVTNIKTNERFIVCKNFEILYDLEDIILKLNKVLYSIQLESLNDSTDNIIYSLISNPIAYYFINKIEESNIIIGQQQLETYDTIINIIKNKNKDEKIETLKRNNIQKCILWCEKYKIPHNKFIDKTNIFLNARIVKDIDVINEHVINEHVINEHVENVII